jgi:molecular chaperone DnaK
MGGVATHLIEKNTTIPTSRSQIFSTAADNQTSTEIHIVQGERAMAADNKSLGRFVLDGIPPAPRGIPQVEVTFDVDANGILNVKAKDKASGKENTIRIEASTGLSKDDIEKMKKDAEMHDADDKKKKGVIEVRNTADQAIYTAEKTLRESKDKLSAELVSAVETKIGALRLSKDKDDVATIKTDTDALSMELAKVHDEIAKANPEAAAGPTTEATQGGEAAGPENPDIKDAEVK